jgi:HPr kinase/phosphorylase
MSELGEYLEELFAPSKSVHGAMMDIYGVGLLFIGKSGVGKSECALDLVARGHRLVADDFVIVKRRGEDTLIAESKENMGHFMEIRGIGIIDVEKLFGVHAIRMQKRIEIAVRLVPWEERHDYEISAKDERYYEILGSNP